MSFSLSAKARSGMAKLAGSGTQTLHSASVWGAAAFCARTGKEAQTSAAAIRAHFIRIPEKPPNVRSPQLRIQHLVDHLRVSLALHGLHRLADEESEQRLLACLVLLDLVG